MKTFILVPIYNERKVLGNWLPRLLKVAREINAQIVVVDDGSEESIVDSLGHMVCSQELSASNLDFSMQSDGLTILRHEVNCGVGAALGTGLAYAKKHGAECVMTIDGDGQHDPEDLLEFYHLLKKENGSLVVNGSRFLKKQWIPIFRRLANFLGNMVTFLLSGFWLTDSQTGMKGFSKNVLKDFEISSVGYEWCIDVFREANWNKWHVKEIPISVVYDLYSLNKGQHFAIGLDMLMKLLIRSLMR